MPARGRNTIQPPGAGPVPGHCGRHWPRRPRGRHRAQGCARNSRPPPGVHLAHSGRRPDRTRPRPDLATACSPAPTIAARPAAAPAPGWPGPADTKLHRRAAGEPEKPEPAPPVRHNGQPGTMPASDWLPPQQTHAEAFIRAGSIRYSIEDGARQAEGRHYTSGRRAHGCKKNGRRSARSVRLIGLRQIRSCGQYPAKRRSGWRPP